MILFENLSLQDRFNDVSRTTRGRCACGHFFFYDNGAVTIYYSVRPRRAGYCIIVINYASRGVLDRQFRCSRASGTGVPRTSTTDGGGGSHDTIKSSLLQPPRWDGSDSRNVNGQDETVVLDGNTNDVCNVSSEQKQMVAFRTIFGRIGRKSYSNNVFV